jgi:hypothetical protein
MAVVGVQHNPVIAAHYVRKRAAGQSKMNALGHCMRKALSIVWGAGATGPDFDPDWGSRLDKALCDLAEVSQDALGSVVTRACGA